MSLDAVERLSRISQPQSRMKIRYSKRIDTTDHHALSPDRCRMRRSQPLADFWHPTSTDVTPADGAPS
jgi:hypothetical protein